MCDHRAGAPRVRHVALVTGSIDGADWPVGRRSARLSHPVPTIGAVSRGPLPPHARWVRPVQTGRAIAAVHRNRDDGPQPPVRGSHPGTRLTCRTCRMRSPVAHGALARGPIGNRTPAASAADPPRPRPGRIPRGSLSHPPRRVRIMTDRSAGSGSGGPSARDPRLAGEALGLLRRLTGDPGAEFRPNQLEAIERLVGRRERVLLGQERRVLHRHPDAAGSRLGTGVPVRAI